MIALAIFLAVIILMTLLITISRSKSPVVGDIGTTTATGLNATSSIPAPVKSAVNFPTVMEAGDAVNVVDQAARDSVSVASVTVVEKTWITVRDGSRVLGAALIGAGTHTDVTVSLLRGTTAGNTYQVVLHTDNGDKAFNVQSDPLVLGSDGMTMGSAFTAR